ncbi:MAG: membrane protein insertion efficiency factor YidD [Verrucomicrobia bacterium]|nr:membrane protein insertion efficiency factor YidD [Verrucomicrobiota bacterium]
MRRLFVESNMEPWGADCELAYPLSVEKKQRASSLGKTVCMSMIRFFQDHISEIDGPRSGFYPTSSQYTLEAIQKYGVLQGIALGCDRLMRENKDWWIYDTTPKYGFDRKIDPVR